MRLVLAMAIGGFLVGGCSHSTPGYRPPPPSDSQLRSDSKESAGDLTSAKVNGPDTRPQIGNATWYGAAFAGRKTANGERFDPTKYTAAHRKLPFGTWVEVRRVDTGATVRVRINDRGPFGDDKRIIDLSRKAAEDIDLVREGVVRVEIRVVDGP